MRHDLRIRLVRLAFLGHLKDRIPGQADIRQALVGEVLRPETQVKCQRMRMQGLNLLFEDGGEVPVQTTFPATLCLHENGQKTEKVWATHLMVLQDGRIFAAANPLVPDHLPFDAFTVVDTDDPPPPPQSGFAEGTRIATPDGQKPVNALQPGDLILTRDAGPQPLLAVDRVTPDTRPNWIEIDRNIIGPDMPNRKLLVTGDTLILSENSVVSRMFDGPTVLLFADRLVDLHGVRTERFHTGPLYQVRLAVPQILFAEGAAVGSAHNPGDHLGRHAHPIPPLARQKSLVLRMWRNGLRTCSGDAPARSRTDRIRHENAMRRQEATARVLPHATAAPPDYKVDEISSY